MQILGRTAVDTVHVKIKIESRIDQGNYEYNNNNYNHFKMPSFQNILLFILQSLKNWRRFPPYNSLRHFKITAT